MNKKFTESETKKTEIKNSTAGKQIKTIHQELEKDKEMKKGQRKWFKK